MDIKRHFYLLGIISLLLVSASCGGPRALVVPHAISTANSIPMGALNLNKGDYEILNTVTQTASISVKYKRNSITIKSLEGDFAYWFKYDLKNGWFLKKFNGTATFGYLMNEPESNGLLLDAAEFSRRVAISKLIDVVKDYGAEGALEPIVTTRVTNSGNNTVEYHTTASAKIVKIHSTN